MPFLDFPVKVLRFTGIFSFPNTSKWAALFFNIYRVIIFFSLVFCMFMMAVKLFLTPDISQLTRTIDLWTVVCSGFYKLCFMIVFRDDFVKFNTALIHVQEQGSAAYGSSADQFMTNCSKTIRTFTMCYLSFGIVTSFLIGLNPLLTYPIGDRSQLEYFNDPNSYPLLFWMPYTVTNYVFFILIFLCQYLASIFTGFNYLSIDSFMFGAIFAIGGQIELLNSSITDIKRSLELAESSICPKHVKYFTESQQQECYYKLRECFIHHILILRYGIYVLVFLRFYIFCFNSYIEKLRKDFSSLIIVDYLHGTISLTFALFQLTICEGVGEMFVIMIFIFMSLSHQFLNNFFGEYILQKLSVGAALLEIPWWRANKKVRDVMQLMILRSMKPTLVTGFYVYKLSNKSFLQFTKSLYTYYMVLRRLNRNEDDA